MQFPSAPAPVRPRSIWIWLGPLLGVAGLIGVLGLVSFVRFCGRATEASGVMAPNQLPASTLAAIEKRQLLLPGEKLVSYYDATLSGDASELALVTTERLVYVKNGRTTAFALADIAEVRHRSEPLVGDVIEAQTGAGELMKIEIAPLNGGAAFLAALESTRKVKRGAPSSP